MAKLIVTVGCPGTGKTTWAKGYVIKNENVIRVSRDDYRRMLFNVKMGNSEQENIITGIVDRTVRKALENGSDVILDATHVKRKYCVTIIDKFNDIADIEFKVFDAPNMKFLQKRNNKRTIKEWVPNDVLQRMYASYKFLISEFDLSPIKRGEGLVDDKMPWYNFTVPEFDKTLPSAIIVDVDGTIADKGDRSPFDWDRVSGDAPKRDVINVVNALSEYLGHRVIVFTGRDDVCKDATESWLRHYGVRFDELYSRDEGDNRKDNIVKFEMYMNHVHQNYNVVGVFDDRNQVVKMWRDIGLTCFQVDYGNF